MIEKSMTMVSTGVSSGTVMWRNRFGAFAPSIAAASYRSCGMVCSPARSEIAKKGVPRQTLTKMTAPMANVGSPKKPAGGYGMCSGPKIHGSGESVGLNASKNASVLSAVGTIYGSSTLERTRFLSGKC